MSNRHIMTTQLTEELVHYDFADPPEGADDEDADDTPEAPRE